LDFIDGQDEIPGSTAKWGELGNGIGVTAGEAPLSNKGGSMLNELNEIGSILVKEFFGTKERDRCEEAVPQCGVSQEVFVIRDDSGVARVWYLMCGVPERAWRA